MTSNSLGGMPVSDLSVGQQLVEVTHSARDRANVISNVWTVVGVTDTRLTLESRRGQGTQCRVIVRDGYVSDKIVGATNRRIILYTMDSPDLDTFLATSRIMVSRGRAVNAVDAFRKSRGVVEAKAAIRALEAYARLVEEYKDGGYGVAGAVSRGTDTGDE